MNPKKSDYRTVHQVAQLTGISVRALHYYDQIGLLVPSQTTGAGYRLYDNTDLERLQQILFFRELDFPLKEIKRLLCSPGYDKKEALAMQKRLLQLKRDRLDGLIKLIDQTMKEETIVRFEEFDMSRIKQAQLEYEKEAEERWGKTEAYAESARRTAKYGKKEWAEISAQAENIYREFAAHMQEDAASPAVQQLVADWQEHITRYYYPCTKEILSGLGRMYIEDVRFTKNIDQYGQGLAAFISRAIAIYCE